MVVTKFGIVIEVNPVSLNALSPMVLRLLLASNVTEVKPEQDANAKFLILVTEFGIVIEVKPEQDSNALFPIIVTESGIVIDVKDDSLNSLSPILVTESGIVMDVNPEQDVNALFPILVTEYEIPLALETLLGITTFVEISIVLPDTIALVLLSTNVYLILLIIII
jgi:hypothetical protein